MKSLFILCFLSCFLPTLAYATVSAPLTGGAAIHASGTVGTGSILIIPKDGGRQFLQIQNNSTNGNNLACTVDGTTPAIGGNGIQLGATTNGSGGAATYDVFVPSGAVYCIGSASSTGYVITYLP